MNNFILTYDVASMEGYAEKAQVFIENHKLIAQWAFVFSGTFFLKSEVDFESLYAGLRNFFTGRFVLVLVEDVTRKGTNGRVSGEIWTWLKSEPLDQISSLLEAETS